MQNWPFLFSVIDVWASAGLLNGPFIFTMASLISESLQICYFPFPPQANDASKPHGSTPYPPTPISVTVAKRCHIYPLILES